MVCAGPFNWCPNPYPSELFNFRTFQTAFFGCSVLFLLKGSITVTIKNIPGRVWWLMPVIPALWEAKVSGSPEVRSSRPAWPTCWNSISTNTKMNQPWWQALIIPVTQEAEAGEWREPGGEAAVSQDHSTAFQPGQHSKTVSKKNKNKPIRSLSSSPMSDTSV